MSKNYNFKNIKKEILNKLILDKNINTSKKYIIISEFSKLTNNNFKYIIPIENLFISIMNLL